MQVKVLNEAGYNEAMLAIAKNKKQSPENMPKVADKLKNLSDDHCKFLRLIDIWVDVDAPLSWWNQFDQYKIGLDLPIDTSSESTMHTLLSRELTIEDFDGEIEPIIIEIVNNYIKEKNIIKAKDNLPTSFKQSRVFKLNYQTLRRIIKQRKTHKLPQWQIFIESILKQIQHPELLDGGQK